MYGGYLRREEEQWDKVRSLMAYTASYGGFGTKKPVKPTDVIQLHKDIKHLITTKADALSIIEHIWNRLA